MVYGYVEIAATVKGQGMITCFVDGGAKPNPGDMYGSFKIYFEGKPTIHNKFTFVGSGTNNRAEYKALITLLQYLDELDTGEPIKINMDSRLVVKQVTGVFRVRNAELMKLKEEVDVELKNFYPGQIEVDTISGKRMKRILGH